MQKHSASTLGHCLVSFIYFSLFCLSISSLLCLSRLLKDYYVKAFTSNATHLKHPQGLLFCIHSPGICQLYKQIVEEFRTNIWVISVKYMKILGK